MDPTNKSQDTLLSTRYRSYKILLESAVMIPFRSLRFLSPGPIFPVLLDQVRVRVDREEESTTKYVVDLSYGRHRWRVVENVIRIFSLNTYLYYKGVTNIIEDRPNLYTNERYNCVEEFLTKVLYKSRLLDIGKVYDFFRISRYSFVGEKRLEDRFYVEISETQEARGCCSIGSCEFSRHFRKMYIVCKKTHLIFVDYKNSHRDVDVLFYTGRLQIYHSRHTFHSRITIIRDEKVYTIKSYSHELTRALFQEVSSAEASLSYRRFSTFSPIRKDNIVNFYVDGKKYFENLYETLRLARKEVFIAGWWVYPTLYLKRKLRDGVLNRRYRLDYVLKRLAERGIRIKILIYREFQMALTINSSYTYEFLSRLHKNIEILRHPITNGHMPVYWSHHEKIVVIDQRIAYLGGIDLTLGRYDTQEHALFDRKAKPRNEVSQQLKSAPLHIRDMREVVELVRDEEGSVWPGMDFSNPLKKEFVDVEHGDRSLIDRSVTPRMPWHDVQCKVVGGSAFDVSRHFIERWNFVAGLDSRSTDIDLLIPDGGLVEEDRTEDRTAGEDHVTTQILRSVGMWSLNTSRERSIENAYLDTISSSKSFIYIENQFFITKCSGGGSGNPVNTIGSRLAERIIRAHRNSETFKVYVVIPLLPAFETNFSTNTSSNVKEVMRAQMESISKGETSLIHVLRSNGVDPHRYVVFMSLRKAHFDGKRVSQEQIYVHSKLLIADGTSVIVGSGNLNDRSMVGDRDTEVALIMEDRSTQAINKLLRQLLTEHLGIGRRGRQPSGHGCEEASIDAFLEGLFTSDGVCDLGREDIFSAIVSRAEINTRIFRELFRSLPDDEVRTVADYLEFSRQAPLYSMDVDRAVIRTIFSRIKGHLVLFPYNFLSDEHFRSSLLSIQGLIPSVVFY